MRIAPIPLYLRLQPLCRAITTWYTTASATSNSAPLGILNGLAARRSTCMGGSAFMPGCPSASG